MLEAPENGVIFIDSTRVGAKVMYDCNVGYDLVGPPERVCADQRTWTGEEPVCNSKFGEEM